MNSEETLNKSREQGRFPAQESIPTKRTIDSALFPAIEKDSISTKFFNLVEKLFSILYKLVLAVVIAFVAIWLYPTDFMSIPFSQMTFGMLASFIFSILLWLLALGVMFSSFFTD